MESICKIYKIGNGPSSSHTIGPRKAALLFKERNTEADHFSVTLYGSLAATGKGHLTDIAIIEAMKPYAVSIIFQPAIFQAFHPNAMFFEAFDAKGEKSDDWMVYSIGGGDLSATGISIERTPIYSIHKMNEVLEWCEMNGKTLWEFVEVHENSEFWDYLREVWQVMKNAIEIGIDTEGCLPGGLNLQRRAPSYFVKASGYKASLKSKSLVFAYALAVSEQNASGGKIVTAPTCGSSGVVPSVLYHLFTSYDFSEKKILKALATAGLIGNLVKKNASISGAEVGCQGEIGTACSMASAAANQLFGGSPSQIEYAAEMGLEHHLGLTCDPVCGLVQIPCIERNAFAAVRALDANIYSMLSDGKHRVSFDRVVSVMRETGHDIPSLYKETSEGGLAKF
ncbi:MAG: L-serine ammonia-lyase [Bacteroidales bacterium]